MKCRWVLLPLYLLLTSPDLLAQNSINISYGSLGVSQVILPLGVRAGIFKQNGLDARAVYIAGRSVLALISGDVKFGFMGGPPALSARLGGNDVVILAGLNRLDQILVSVPTINKREDLIGKKAGISRFGTTSEYGVRLGLKRMNLVPQKDVAVVQVGDTNARTSALLSGAIQLAAYNAGDAASVKKLGLKVLADISDLPFPGSVMVTTDSYKKSNRQVVKQFVKSLVDIIRFVKTKPEETKRWLAQIYGDPDPGNLDGRYKTMQQIFPEYPYITKESIEEVLALYREDGQLKKTVDADAFLDSSFLRDVEKEMKR